MLRRRRIFTWVSLTVALSFQAEGAETALPDLELVVAVDVSDSMSSDERLIQRQGYVAALRDADVAAAVVSRGSIAVTYMEWAGPRSQKIVVGWTILSSAEDAGHFADKLAAAPLSPGFPAAPWETGTSISQALLFGAGIFSGDRVSRVIDISGDGMENTGATLPAVRERLIAEGITINGLPVILRHSDDGLVEYYENNVIGGPGAFAIPVESASRFAQAIRRKLIIEIAGKLTNSLMASSD